MYIRIFEIELYGLLDLVYCKYVKKLYEHKYISFCLAASIDKFEIDATSLWETE